MADTMTLREAERTLAQRAEREAKEREAEAVLKEQRRAAAARAVAAKREALAAEQRGLVDILEQAVSLLGKLTPDQSSRVNHEAMTVRTAGGRGLDLPPGPIAGLGHALAAERRRLAELEATGD